MSVNPDEVLILDVQTPNAKNDRACSVVALNFSGATALATLVDPQTEFSPVNSLISGIDADAVKGAPTLLDLWNDRLRALVEKRVVVGYGVRFDLDVLSRALIASGAEPPVARILDLAPIVRRAFDLTNYALEDVAEELGIDFDRRRIEDAPRVVRAALWKLLQTEDADEMKPVYYFYDPKNKKKPRW